ECLAKRPGNAVDERAGGRIVGLPVEHEARVPADHDVQLFVPVLLLAVLLDQALSGLLRGVGGHAERLDAEVAADREPCEAVLALDREALELVDPGDVVAHVCLLSSSSTTGSTCSTPSRRSSRFSLPAQVKNASPRSPS